MRSSRVRWAIVVAGWLLGLAALPLLPNPSPIHWNAMGQPDGFGSPLVAALLMPAILTGIAALAPLLPRVDPRGAGYVDFRPTYELFLNAIAVFLLGVHGLALADALGLPVDMGRWVTVGLGLLFAVLGNELGRVQPNYFVGIRTPWTLADTEVWRRTHRSGGRAIAAAGALTTVQALVVPTPWALYIALALVLGATLYSVGLSYFVFRSLSRGKAS
jgi:uncharacterized membrane protein